MLSSSVLPTILLRELLGDPMEGGPCQAGLLERNWPGLREFGHQFGTLVQELAHVAAGLL